MARGKPAIQATNHSHRRLCFVALGVTSWNSCGTPMEPRWNLDGTSMEPLRNACGTLPQGCPRPSRNLVEPWNLCGPLWNLCKLNSGPHGTLPQGLPGPPRSLSGLRPQSFQLEKKRLDPRNATGTPPLETKKNANSLAPA